MDQRGQSQRAQLWERVVEVTIALAVVIGLTAWIIIDRNRQQNAAEQATGDGLSVVTTAPIKINLSYVTNGLKSVTAMGYIRGDDRLYVAEQRGTVRMIKGGKLETQPVLDISSKVRNADEMGLIGLAFDPLMQSNPFVYVHYSDARDGASVIARYTLNDDRSRADPASERVILRQFQPFPNHNGGQLAFGPDEYLYIGFGDGGGAGDPQNNAQNLNTWLGKILRIDVHNVSPYSVPDSNPFINKAGIKPEIWDYGLRNPWRFSFDDIGRRMIIADVGQKNFEEINVEKLERGGNNYGWRCYEGEETYDATGCAEKKTMTMPRVSYAHAEDRCSITGGYVYNGSRLSGLNARYIYGDFCTGEIWSLEYLKASAMPRLELNAGFKISTFGEDNSNNIYVADYDAGIIYRIVYAV
jgi:glucose/arabinose dehydrogenase